MIYRYFAIIVIWLKHFMGDVHMKITLKPNEIPDDLKKYFKPKKKNGSWILRNKIVWYKRNAMPSSAKDRFTMDWENVFFFTKQGRYYFEQQFEPFSEATKNDSRFGQHIETENTKDYMRANMGRTDKDPAQIRRSFENLPNKLGRNKRCVWDIPTKSFKEAHFATFPEELVEPMIKSSVPEFICNKCGKPREKIRKSIGVYDSGIANVVTDKSKPYAVLERDGLVEVRDLPNISAIKTYLNIWRKEAGYTIEAIEEKMDSQAPHHWFNGESYPTKEDWFKIKALLGFDDTFDRDMTDVKLKPAEKCQTQYKEILTDCGCNAGFHSGVVYDPFMGAGTVAVVAKKLNRHYVGSEMNPKYIEMAERRINRTIYEPELFNT